MANISIEPKRFPSPGALFAAWTALGLAACARYWLVNPGRPAAALPEVLGWLTCYYAWLLLTLPIFVLEACVPLGLGRRLRNLSILVAAGLAYAYAAYQINALLTMLLHAVFPQQQPLHVAWFVPAREYALELALYGFTVIAAVIYRSLYELRQKERLAARLALEKSQLEASLHQAQLETLRMRLNPHFLFNCLQNISTLSLQQPAVSAHMLIKLGNLLRSALKQSSEPESTLREELDLTRTYLDIEQMRFADHLSILTDIDPATQSALVPALLLQPIAENAIQHGLRDARSNSVISIASRRVENTLTLTIRDNGSGIGSRSLAEIEMGTGLGSTCERLARMYPSQHTFSIRDLPEGGTEVAIVLPFRLTPSPAEHEYPAFTHSGR
jgi:two-component system, LytTR family, sensor kinase